MEGRFGMTENRIRVRCVWLGSVPFPSLIDFEEDKMLSYRRETALQGAL